MKMLLSGIVAAIALGVVASVVLSYVQQPTYLTQSTPSVRVGDPGHNLVGENWSGMPRAAQD